MSANWGDNEVQELLTLQVDDKINCHITGTVTNCHCNVMSDCLESAAWHKRLMLSCYTSCHFCFWNLAYYQKSLTWVALYQSCLVCIKKKKSGVKKLFVAAVLRDLRVKRRFCFFDSEWHWAGYSSLYLWPHFQRAAAQPWQSNWCFGMQVEELWAPPLGHGLVGATHTHQLLESQTHNGPFCWGQWTIPMQEIPCRPCCGIVRQKHPS